MDIYEKINNSPAIKTNVSAFTLSVSITLGNRMPPEGPNEGTIYRFMSKRHDEISEEKHPWDPGLTPKLVVLQKWSEK